MSSCVGKSLASWADHLVVVNNATLEELELIPFVGDKDTLETAFRPEVVVIAHAIEELEEAISGIDFLK